MNKLALSTKLSEIRTWIENSVHNKSKLHLQYAGSANPVKSIVALYVDNIIKNLSKIAADLLNIEGQIKSDVSGEGHWFESLLELSVTIQQKLNNNIELYNRIDQQYPVKTAVSDLLDENIQELSLIQTNLRAAISLSNV